MGSAVFKVTIDEMHNLPFHFQSSILLSSLSTRYRKNRVEVYIQDTFTSEIKTKRFLKNI